MSSFGVTVYDPGNEPIRPAHLDDCDNRAVLVQRKERSTQVNPLWHGALHRWFPATMVLRLAARPIASVMQIRRFSPLFFCRNKFLLGATGLVQDGLRPWQAARLQRSKAAPSEG